jgi:hypothetical protein
VDTTEPVARQQAGGHGRHITAIKRRSRQRAVVARQRVAYRAVPISSLTPTVSIRSQDRVLLASGVVLGVIGAVATRILAQTARTAKTALRPGSD